MTIYYVDPANGSDSNDGLSWGTAWKTITNGATLARLPVTTDDEVRIAKSPDPVSIGTQTWTHNSPTLTFTGCSNVTIDNCESGWSAGLVTPTYTTSYYRQGSNSMQVVLSSTNGKVCYKTLTSTDYSAFSRITFWVNFSSSVNYSAGAPIYINLCSDTAGATPVVQFQLPTYYYVGNYWCPITLSPTTGSFASATAIQSISISTTSAVSNTIRFDNIQVAKAASDATSLVLTDFISKQANQLWFYPSYIDGTTVGIIPHVATRATNTLDAKNYYYSVNGTESVTTIKRAVFDTAAAIAAISNSTVINQLRATDTSYWPSKKLYTGGWNTSTNVVDGETWFDGVTGYGYGIDTGSGTTYSQEFRDISAVRYYNNYVVNVKNYIVCSNAHATASTASAVEGTVYGNVSYSDDFKQATFGFKSIVVPHTTISAAAMRHNSLASFASAAANITFNIGELYSLSSVANVQTMQLQQGSYIVNITGTWYNSSWGYSVANFSDAAVVVNASNIVVNNNDGNALFTSGVFGTTSLRNGRPPVLNVSGKFGMPWGASYASSMVQGAGLIVNGTTPAATAYLKYYASGTGNVTYTNFNIDTAVLTPQASQGINIGRCTFHNHNNVAGDHRIYNANISSGSSYVNNFWGMQTATTYTGTSSWKFTAGTAYSTNGAAPAPLPIGTVVCKAGSQVTVTIRGYRSSANIKCTLCVSNNVDAYTSTCTTTGQWELLTVTFTPTQNATYDIHAIASAYASGVTCYVDDLQVTQV